MWKKLYEILLEINFVTGRRKILANEWKIQKKKQKIKKKCVECCEKGDKTNFMTNVLRNFVLMTWISPKRTNYSQKMKFLCTSRRPIKIKSILRVHQGFETNNLNLLWTLANRKNILLQNWMTFLDENEWNFFTEWYSRPRLVLYHNRTGWSGNFLPKK